MKKMINILLTASMLTSCIAVPFSASAVDANSTQNSISSGPSTQADALRYMLSNYINDNNIDAWIYDNDAVPEGKIFIGYYKKNENIPVDIIKQVESKGFDPQLVNFVQEDHTKDGYIEDIDVISRLIDHYITENALNAWIVPKYELPDNSDDNILYVEYTEEETEIPDRISAYMKEKKIAPELVKFGAEGSLSKQTEQTDRYTFEEFCKLSDDEVKALFISSGDTDGNRHRVWTETEAAQLKKLGRVFVLYSANPYPVADPELAYDYRVCWEDDKLAEETGLPAKLFRIKQYGAMTVNNTECCSFLIEPKTTEAEKLLAAALNYVQLDQYYETFYYDYIAVSTDTPEETLNVSEKLKNDIDAGLEKIDVMMWCTFKIDYSKIHPEVNRATEEYMNTLDTSVYSAEEINEMVGAFKNNLSDKMYQEAYAAKTKEVCDFIGIDVSEANFTSTALRCSLTPEQIYKIAGTDLVKGRIIEQSEFVSAEDLGYQAVEADTENVKGDANCDGTADMADAVLVMQALANPDKYGENGTSEHHITAKGKANADMNGDGLTVSDAQTIQKSLLGITDN